MSLQEVKNEERLSNTSLRSVVEDMLHYVNTEECRTLKQNDPQLYMSTLEEKYSDFKDRYPGLYQSIMLGGQTFDKKKLEWMLSLLDQRNNGLITPEQSDKTVVFTEFNKHVKDKIDWEKEKKNFVQYSEYTKQ